MIGLYIFGVLIFAGIVTLIVFKVMWSIQDKRKWAVINARNNSLK